MFVDTRTDLSWLFIVKIMFMSIRMITIYLDKANRLAMKVIVFIAVDILTIGVDEHEKAFGYGSSQSGQLGTNT